MKIFKIQPEVAKNQWQIVAIETKLYDYRNELKVPENMYVEVYGNLKKVIKKQHQKMVKN